MELPSTKNGIPATKDNLSETRKEIPDYLSSGTTHPEPWEPLATTRVFSGCSDRSTSLIWQRRDNAPRGGIRFARTSYTAGVEAKVCAEFEARPCWRDHYYCAQAWSFREFHSLVAPAVRPATMYR